MRPGSPLGTIGAAVDLGSTSVHLLVARIDGRELEPLVDESAFLGLGDAVAERGFLGGPAREALVDALAHQAWTAREAGASVLGFVGTEPLRRLADAARIVAEIDAGTGVPIHALDHVEEGLLTLIGVTGGRPVERDLLVIDIGGGSTEIVSVGPGRRATASGLRLGAAALTARVRSGAPPTKEDLAAMRRAAREAVASAPDAPPSEIVLVGGTASNLLKVVPAPGSAVVNPEALRAVRRLVVAERPEAIAETFRLRPQRARLLPAGAAIVEAILERYGRDARVSNDGIREGAVRVLVHAGAAWRDCLQELAHGWPA